MCGNAGFDVFVTVVQRENWERRRLSGNWMVRETVEPNYRHKNRERTQRKGVNIHLDTGSSRLLFLTLSRPDRYQAHNSSPVNEIGTERNE